MERGLIWLPLLILFGWLAWAGWNEYQKVEAYRAWAASFERAKYDIYAVLGQKADQITWGRPTRKGPTGLQSFSLNDLQTLQLQVDGQRFALDQGLEKIPNAGRTIALLFQLRDQTVQIPFTDLQIAQQWGQYLQRYELPNAPIQADISSTHRSEAE